MCRCWESCWMWHRERKKNNILAETEDLDAKTKKGVDKIIRLSYNKCRWFKQTGEMAEWFMALVLKTSDTARYRGFESLSLRKSLLKEISEGFFISVYFLHIHSLSMTRRLQMQNYAILFGHIKENM